jgi:putative heme-binding domain-containing protein
MGIRASALLVVLFSAQTVFAQLKDARVADYDQWKLALGKGAVAQPVTVQTLPGFRIDVVRVASPEEGSWISLACDPRGRLIVGREDKGLLRITLAADGRSSTTVESIDDTLLECRGLLYAHDSLYAHANNSKGLYRLKDTDGDDRFDEVRLLRRTEGGVGHGRNSLALGPDEMIYCTLGNNVQIPAETSPESPYRGYGNDRLVSAPWNEFLFDGDVVPPAGHIARTDPEGTRWELFAGGFRNPYGLAFNRDGELFTYDADMEWDEGAPWYRPTSVIHVVAGGEYGWRQETSLWPDHFADLLPRAVDIGLGSPTGARFGDRSHFPEAYRKAFFVLDWAYGRIIAVHLTAEGASYRGRAETFVKGKPLNVCDLEFGHDGAMYFVVGGRRTQSAIYRVSYTGDSPTGESESARPQEDGESARLRTVRRRHADPDRKTATGEIDWNSLSKSLGHADPWIRHSGRVALERLPPAAWADRALAEDSPLAATTALLSLARVSQPRHQPGILDRLLDLSRQPLSPNERLILLRGMQLALARGKPPSPELAARLGRAIAEGLDPARSTAEKQLVCELLVFLDTPGVVARTLDCLEASADQQEALTYLLYLNQVRQPWTLEEQRRRLNWLKRADSFVGAHYMHTFVTFLRTDALASLRESDRAALTPQISELGKVETPGAAEPVAPASITRWTLEGLTSALDAVARERDLRHGREIFHRASCSRCHRIAGRGIPFGPDLDGVASRFGRRDLLETILDPSRAVDHKYRSVQIETRDGLVITGQLAGGNRETLFVVENPLAPAQVRSVSRAAIANRTPSDVSPMPAGLLNTLSRDDILDLMSYLEFSEDSPR